MKKIYLFLFSLFFIIHISGKEYENIENIKSVDNVLLFPEMNILFGVSYDSLSLINSSFTQDTLRNDLEENLENPPKKYTRIEEFVRKSSLKGNLYFWDRNRERLDYVSDDYKNDIIQSTFTGELNFKTAPIAKMFSIELAGYGVWQPHGGGRSHPDEIAFSKYKSRWDEGWDKDVDGVSFYRALLDFNWKNIIWAKIGYLQPSGQTLIAPHWSLLPGTYRGFEIGSVLDFQQAGALSASFMWTDKYKAPWYRELYKFYQMGNDSKKVDYLYSIGVKYDMKNNFITEFAYGHSEGYINQYFAKASYQLKVFNNPLNMSYQFYGTEDQKNSGTKMCDGLAWTQGLTFSYKAGPLGFRLEGTAIHAPGEQGFFLQRMTSSYASSQGRMDIWWNSRSDFNADGEKSVFGEVSYNLRGLAHFLDGFTIAASYVYASGARPSKNPTFDQSQRIWERAWNLDLSYVINKGWAKGTVFQLHYTNYHNNSKHPSWGGGFGNVFQDEHDLKFFIIFPFTILNPKNN